MASSPTIDGFLLIIFLISSAYPDPWPAELFFNTFFLAFSAKAGDSLPACASEINCISAFKLSVNDFNFLGFSHHFFFLIHVPVSALTIVPVAALFIFLNVLARLYRLVPLGQVGPPNFLPVQGLSLRIFFVAF